MLTTRARRNPSTAAAERRPQSSTGSIPALPNAARITPAELLHGEGNGVPDHETWQHGHPPFGGFMLGSGN